MSSMGLFRQWSAGGSGLAGEICQPGPERAVLLDGGAKVFGCRVLAVPGGEYRFLLFPGECDERLDAVIDETGRHFGGGARVIDEHRRDLVPAGAHGCGGAGGRGFRDGLWLRV